MEHQKVLNLLNQPNNCKFVTKKCNIFNNIRKANYNAGNEIAYNTEILKFKLCDYNDVYFLVKSDITVTVASETQLSFKNCAPFIKCISHSNV